MIALLLIILCLVTSCIKTEVIGLEKIPAEMAGAPITKARPKPMTPPEHPKDTTAQDGRVPIGFNPTVADWDELTEKTTL